MSSQRPHIVVGGGIIGLSIAWQLARAGQRVELFEESTVGRSGASWVAAGMLAPQAEAGYEEEKLFRLCQESLRQYDQFLAELREDVVISAVPKLDRCGSMMIAVTSDDRRLLERQHTYRTALGCTGMSWLTGSEAREREPLLSPKVKSVLLMEDEAQVDNRALLTSLHEAFVNRGGIVHEWSPVQRILSENGIVTGIESNEAYFAGATVTLAAGVQSQGVQGVTSPGLRPVKGQIVTLRSNEFERLHYVLRSPRVYIAAKEDGRLVVGASVEEQGYDRRVTAGPIMELLHYAWEIMPASYEYEIEELRTGLRPATADHLPVLGEQSIRGLWYAVGHYRNGILLSPYTTYSIANGILDSTRSFAHTHVSQENRVETIQ